MKIVEKTMDPYWEPLAGKAGQKNIFDEVQIWQTVNQKFVK